ncbi:hypothetical protein F5148DRAFT_126725 [Russula earlei]|uniref:Uncharacterized protein n=1 Tax=Russula earlei TaxID=71964 RepID=A0ACC0UK24_9AGAM|nr:hypothetical protein F5148DRAFT_126725 [Russula earlei]
MISSGPATIIYNEGGQRAEEDDLNDDDPVASAYVSRAPSPPPVLDSQLPVPERSLLEVPNATTSIRSSKSRASPPDLDVVDKGKGREDAALGSTHSRSLSIPRNIPGGIELPGPIALTDSNSSRRSGSGRLGETLTSIWGNIPPSTGPSANSSVLPSPLEGPSSRSALLNALRPLASVPEGSAIPEVVHADAIEPVVPEVYRPEPPKTPKAETPHASTSPSRALTSASAAATSPKATGTPKAPSRIPTTAASPRTAGTPRGLSIYSNVAQPPPAAATPRALASGAVSPVHVAPSTEVPPEQPTIAEPEATQIEAPANLTPKPGSRAPSKVPTRVPSPKAVQPPVTDPVVIGAEPRSVVSEQPSGEHATEPAAAEEEDFFGWGQPRSKATSRKGSKATSKAASKLASKAPSPKGAETPKPPESTSEGVGASLRVEFPPANQIKSPARAPSPLATVAEDSHAEVPVEAFSTPGGFFVTNPDPAADGTQPPPPHTNETPNVLPPHLQVNETPNDLPTQATTDPVSFGGSLFGAATSALGWGFGKKEGKSKSPTPKVPTPGWGAFGSAAPSVTESLGGVGWGAATGNNNGPTSAWGFEGGNKSTNASTADLIGGSGITDTLMQPPAGNGEAHYQLPLDETPGAEGQKQESLPTDSNTKEHLIIQTDIAAEPAGDATEPNTAAGDSPEDVRGGEGGEGGEEEADWAFPIKQKKKKGGNASANTATPVTPAAATDEAVPGGKKNKKGKKGK